MKLAAAFLLSISISAGLSAQTVADSLRTSFRPRQLIAPSVLIGVGAAGLTSWWAQEINNPVKDYAAGLRGDSFFPVDNYICYLPVVFGAGLSFLPEYRERRWNIITTAAVATVMETLVVGGIKYCVREDRPDGGKYSFPSGHTAAAFMGAELVRAEYGGWPGTVAYIVAAATGILRVYNERHWCNDVLAGAGIGILCSRAAMWMMPFRPVPSLVADPEKGAVPVLALSYSF